LGFGFSQKWLPFKSLEFVSLSFPPRKWNSCDRSWLCLFSPFFVFRTVVTVSFLFLSLPFLRPSADVQPKPSANFPRCGSRRCVPRLSAPQRRVTFPPSVDHMWKDLLLRRTWRCNPGLFGSKIFSEADGSVGSNRPQVIADLNFLDTDKSFVKLTDILQVGNCR
jgi:hypothetical protein